MELRLLTTEAERQTFARRMEEARAKLGAHFRETQRSAMGMVHLAFGQLYGLFENCADPTERMMSGFIMHDLATLAQSYPKPDLTHLPPRAVLECGELWSFAKGAGLLARRGAAILAGLFQAQAIVVYPVVSPWDNTRSYGQIGFVRADQPVAWPYCELLDGGPIYVQAMVLEGAPLMKLIHRAFEMGFETCDSHRKLRFDNPFEVRPTLERPVLEVPRPVTEFGGYGINGSTQI
jgi:hypothetical protein